MHDDIRRSLSSPSHNLRRHLNCIEYRYSAPSVHKKMFFEETKISFLFCFSTKRHAIRGCASIQQPSCWPDAVRSQQGPSLARNSGVFAPTAHLLPVVLARSIASNCVVSHFDYWAPSLPAFYCLSHFTRACRTKFPASGARKLRACTTCASSRSTRVLRQVCAVQSRILLRAHHTEIDRERRDRDKDRRVKDRKRLHRVENHVRARSFVELRSERKGLYILSALRTEFSLS
jgi:hypothetical protein